jgi:hypothetical protein
MQVSFARGIQTQPHNPALLAWPRPLSLIKNSRKMDKITAQYLDSILEYLDKSKFVADSWDSVLNLLKINYDKYNFSLLSILKTKGYINVLSSENAPPDVQITDEGRAFIHTSSFFRSLRQTDTDVKRENIKLIIASVSPIIAIISIVVNIYLNDLKNDYKELNLKLESENKTLQISLDSIYTKNDSVSYINNLNAKNNKKK